MKNILTKKEGQKDDARTYLDYAASTPLTSEAKECISELLDEYGNPSSIHKEGVRMRASIEGARKKVAQCLGALAEEIYFTSGSTEGLNLAIQGVVEKARETNLSPHIVSSAIEHPAIIETLKALEKTGVEVEYLTPDHTGVVSSHDIRFAIKKETVLLVFSYVHSEIGTVLPLSEYVKELRLFRKKVTGEKLPYILLDATQAPLYHSLNVEHLSIDLMVIDGGKIGALSSSGVLYVKRHVSLLPVMFGGGQERGIRPGTQNVMAIIVIAKALEDAQLHVQERAKHVKELSDFFVQRLRGVVPSITLNGQEDNLSPHIISLCFPGIDAEWLVLQLDAAGISVSRGSACKSGKGNESQVLRVINPPCKECSIRFSLGNKTTKEELEQTIEVVKRLTGIGAPLSDA
ncbi:MAG: cysteine desulfurase family protein [Candidatus Paceibacterota bacterium]